MVRKALFFSILTMSLVSCSQYDIEGSGVPAREVRDLEPFTSIKIDGAYDVEVTCQDTSCVEIQADDNIVPHIITKVDNRQLTIFSNESFRSNHSLNLRLTTRDIVYVTSNGANKIALRDVDNNALKVMINGAGIVRASGQTEKFTAELSGAANLDAQHLQADKVWIKLQGVGNAGVFAKRELRAGIYGGGHIEYYGNPAVISKNIIGVGSIRGK